MTSIGEDERSQALVDAMVMANEPATKLTCEFYQKTRVNGRGPLPSSMSYASFVALYNSMEVSASTPDTQIRAHGKSHRVVFVYDDDMRVTYTMTSTTDNSPPVIETRSTIGKLEIQYDNNKVAILRVRKHDDTHKELPAKAPLYVEVEECWEYTYKDSVRYTLTKRAAGKTKEHACLHRPVLGVRLELLPGQHLHESTTENTRCKFIAKINDIARWKAPPAAVKEKNKNKKKKRKKRKKRKRKEEEEEEPGPGTVKRAATASGSNV